MDEHRQSSRRSSASSRRAQRQPFQPPVTTPPEQQDVIAPPGTAPLQPTAGDNQQGDEEKKSKRTKFKVLLKEAISIVGRPDWLKSAKEKMVNQGQDRRHVLGWEDFIKPTLSRGLDEIMSQKNNEETMNILIEIAQEKGYKAPKKQKNLEEASSSVAKWLNSTPNNLNVEDAVENQAIETVKEQIVKGLNDLKEKVEKEDIITFQEAKRILLDVVSASGASTARVQFADAIREIIRSAITGTEDEDMVSLIRWAFDFKTSTAIDLSKKEGAKDQTKFALKLANECRNLSGEDLIKKLVELRDIPKEP